MRVILKHIHSPDVFDIVNFKPKVADNFCMLLQLIVSPAHIDGEESFDVILCTPMWILDNFGLTDIIIGRHYLIVFEYNYHRIYSKLKGLIESIEADSWDEISNLLGRLGKWEFEDYK